MGLFEKIFRRPRGTIQADGFFELLNGYTPVFTNAPESIYEMELIRAAIHSFASFCGKLKPEISGSAYKSLEKTLQFRPNPFMDTSKFVYRIATILSVNNTAFIVPLEDEGGGIVGYYPILPQRCEVVEVKGEPFLRYTFSNGQRATIEFDRVGILTQFQYDDDFFGADNRALKPTTQLFDRGLLTRNAVMDIWNMAHVEDGDKYYIRKEYTEVSELGREGLQNANSEGSGIPNDDASAGDGDGRDGEAV